MCSSKFRPTFSDFRTPQICSELHISVELHTKTIAQTHHAGTHAGNSSRLIEINRVIIYERTAEVLPVSSLQNNSKRPLHTPFRTVTYLQAELSH